MPKNTLKFLIDIGVGKRVEQWLRDHGYDTKTMRDIDPKAEDATILNIAASETRMVVTMDKGFWRVGIQIREVACRSLDPQARRCDGAGQGRDRKEHPR